jgi:tetratricopeptide (TPR) repeat protein
MGEGRDPAALERLVVALTDVCERADRPADARGALEHVLALLPDHPVIERRLERIYEKSAEVECLSQLLSARADRTADPVDKAALLLRAARALAERDDGSSSVLGLLERAHAADPTNVEAALACAKIFSTTGRPLHAAVLLAEVVERHRGKRLPILARVHLELGKAHLALDELAEAFGELKTSFALDARCPEVALLLGLVAVDLDEGATAERALLAVTLLPARHGLHEGTADRACALYHLASLAFARGDVTKARAWAGKAVALAADHRDAAALLERCGRS